MVRRRIFFWSYMWRCVLCNLFFKSGRRQGMVRRGFQRVRHLSWCVACRSQGFHGRFMKSYTHGEGDRHMHADAHIDTGTDTDTITVIISITATTHPYAHTPCCVRRCTHTRWTTHTQEVLCAPIYTRKMFFLCVGGRWRSHIGSHVFFSKRMIHVHRHSHRHRHNHNHDNIHTHTHTHTLDKSYQFASVLQMFQGQGQGQGGGHENKKNFKQIVGRGIEFLLQGKSVLRGGIKRYFSSSHIGFLSYDLTWTKSVSKTLARVWSVSVFQTVGFGLGQFQK